MRFIAFKNMKTWQKILLLILVVFNIFIMFSPRKIAYADNETIDIQEIQQTLYDGLLTDNNKTGYFPDFLSKTQLQGMITKHNEANIDIGTVIGFYDISGSNRYLCFVTLKESVENIVALHNDAPEGQSQGKYTAVDENGVHYNVCHYSRYHWYNSSYNTYTALSCGNEFSWYVARMPEDWTNVQVIYTSGNNTPVIEDTIEFTGIEQNQTIQTGAELDIKVTINGYKDKTLTYKINGLKYDGSFFNIGETFDNKTYDLNLTWDKLLVGQNTIEIVDSIDNTVYSTINFNVEEKPASFWDIFNVLRYINPFHEDFFLRIAFVPQEGYFNNYFNDIKVAFDEKIPIVTQIYDLLHELITVDYDETKTPEIMMTMPESYGGGTYNLINLEPFRPYRNSWITLIRIPMWYMFIRRSYATIVSMV